jgi:hypothetical protein
MMDVSLCTSVLYVFMLCTVLCVCVCVCCVTEHTLIIVQKRQFTLTIHLIVVVRTRTSEAGNRHTRRHREEQTNKHTTQRKQVRYSSEIEAMSAPCFAVQLQLSASSICNLHSMCACCYCATSCDTAEINNASMSTLLILACAMTSVFLQYMYTQCITSTACAQLW